MTEKVPNTARYHTLSFVTAHLGHLPYIAAPLSVDNPRDMACPSFKRFPPLGEELVPLIDRRNTRDRSALMIQDFIGNVGCNAKPRHARHASAPQIMQTPAGHSGKLVKPALGTAERRKRLGARG